MDGRHGASCGRIDDKIVMVGGRLHGGKFGLKKWGDETLHVFFGHLRALAHLLYAVNISTIFHQYS